MNFEKAHKELLSGKKIRRKEWDPLMHMKMVEGEVVTFRGEYSNFYQNPNILISNKWKVVEGDNKELSFLEALEELKNKKSIRLDSWQEDSFLFIDKNQFAYCKPVQFDFMPSYQELLAQDWEILK